MDEDGNPVPLGGEFQLEENEHFNKLRVNTDQSNIQVPTNVYNKGTEAWTHSLHSLAHTVLQYTSAFHLNVSFICSPSFCRSRYSERSLYVWGSEWRVHWELQERSNSHLAVFWQRHRLFQTLPRFIHIGVSRMLVSPNSQHLQLLVSHASAQCWDNTNRAVDKHSATQAKRRTYTATDDAGNCLSNMMMTQSLP